MISSLFKDNTTINIDDEGGVEVGKREGVNSITNFGKDGKIHFCEIIGGRPTQEDRYLCAGAAFDIYEEAQSFLKETFTYIESQTKELNSGTCTIMAIFSKDGRLTIANVGDSQAVVYLEKDGVITSEQLNKLHNCDNPDEVNRIRSNGGSVRLDDCGELRVNRLLSVTRAFGDRPYRGANNNQVTSTPDIHTYNLSTQILNGFKVYVEISCDGLRIKYVNGQVFFSEKNISGIIQNRGSKKNLAAEVVDAAIRSNDNETCFIIEVPTNLEELDENLVCAVMDGHVDHTTAEKVQELLDKRLKEHNLSKQQKNEQPVVPNEDVQLLTEEIEKYNRSESTTSDTPPIQSEKDQESTRKNLRGQKVTSYDNDALLLFLQNRITPEEYFQGTTEKKSNNIKYFATAALVGVCGVIIAVMLNERDTESLKTMLNNMIERITTFLVR